MGNSQNRFQDKPESLQEEARQRYGAADPAAARHERQERSNERQDRQENRQQRPEHGDRARGMGSEEQRQRAQQMDNNKVSGETRSANPRAGRRDEDEDTMRQDRLDLDDERDMV